MGTCGGRLSPHRHRIMGPGDKVSRQAGGCNVRGAYKGRWSPNRCGIMGHLDKVSGVPVTAACRVLA